MKQVTPPARRKTLRVGEVYETYDPLTGAVREVLRVVDARLGCVVVEVDADVAIRVRTREYSETLRKRVD